MKSRGPVRPVISAFAALLALAAPAMAEKTYDPGVSDTEIKIGNIMPYSGPFSAYGVMGKAEAAYFEKVNAAGGINGRKIKFISYDDASSPPKTVEQARKLVESDDVFLVFSILGTASNAAVQKYMNGKKVPQLFVASGAVKWGDPKRFPWTMGWRPSYQTEGRVYAKYILDNKPDSKIAILYQNDDFGKDMLKGVKDGLADKYAMVVAIENYESTDPTIDGHIVSLKASGADTFIALTSPKFEAQALKKSKELGWQPMHMLSSTSSSVGGVIKPAGYDAAQGVLSVAFLKDVTDPEWKDDPGVKAFDAFVKEWYPGADRTDNNVAYGMMVAETLVQVLKMCGDNLTRENVMKQAANLKDFELGLLLPGIKLNTSADDFFPIEQEQLIRFKGEGWERFGPIIDGQVRE